MSDDCDALDFYTARLAALDSEKGWPFLAPTLLRLTLVVTDQVPTFATDRHWRVYVNPTFLAGCSASEAAVLVVHEAWHHLGLDWLRAEKFCVQPGLEAWVWNYFKDAEQDAKDGLVERMPVNCQITWKSLGLPDGLMTEEAMQIWRDDPSKVKVPPMPPGGGAGRCGGGCSGHAAPWEIGDPISSGVLGVTPEQADLIRAQTAQAIKDQQKSRGNVPAGWIRWADSILKPRVDWRRELPAVLRGAVSRQAGRTTPDWGRFSRRRVDPRILPPGRQDILPQVDFIIDTSGSMSKEQLTAGVAEVDGILRTYGNGVDVCVRFTDAAAYAVQTVQSARLLKPIGGGGTDMREGFKAVEEDVKAGRRRPGVIVCATDGLTPWPAQPPSFDVSVVVVLIHTKEDGPAWCKPPRHRTLRIQP